MHTEKGGERERERRKVIFQYLIWRRLQLNHKPAKPFQLIARLQNKWLECTHVSSKVQYIKCHFVISSSGIGETESKNLVQIKTEAEKSDRRTRFCRTTFRLTNFRINCTQYLISLKIAEKEIQRHTYKLHLTDDEGNEKARQGPETLCHIITIVRDMSAHSLRAHALSSLSLRSASARARRNTMRACSAGCGVTHHSQPLRAEVTGFRVSTHINFHEQINSSSSVLSLLKLSLLAVFRSFKLNYFGFFVRAAEPMISARETQRSPRWHLCFEFDFCAK